MELPQITLQEFYEDYWWPRCESRLRECTLVGYNNVWSLHIAPYMKNMQLTDITPRYLDSWIKEHNINNNTWRVFKALIRVAYKMEFIERDPCDRVLDPPTRKIPNSPTLNRQQLQEVMNGLIDVPYYPVIVCSATMGLRREESCGLRWEDFDWNTNKVFIQRGMQWISGHIVINEPKTKKSKRRLPIPKDTINRLYSLRKEEGYIAGNLNPSQIACRYKRACKSRNLPYVPISNLRTSWCTMLINEGVPISKVSLYMGHADVSTTVRWYTKPNEEDLLDVASLI